MTEKELNEMTVMQLRKLAKENDIILGAGIDKAGIVKKILESDSSDLNSETYSQKEAGEQEPRFQAAWHNSDSPKFNARPAYQAPGSAPRPAWQNTTPSGHQLPVQPRVQSARPGVYTPRFGPAVTSPSPAADPAPLRKETSAPSAGPLPEHRFGDSSYSHRITSNYTPAYTAPRTPEPFSPVQVQEAGISAPTLEELLASGNYEEGSGILELHPDGYGFLRAPSFLRQKIFMFQWHRSVALGFAPAIMSKERSVRNAKVISIQRSFTFQQ